MSRQPSSVLNISMYFYTSYLVTQFYLERSGKKSALDFELNMPLPYRTVLLKAHCIASSTSVQLCSNVVVQ